MIEDIPEIIQNRHSTCAVNWSHDPSIQHCVADAVAVPHCLHVDEPGQLTLPGNIDSPRYVHPLYGPSVNAPRAVGKLIAVPVAEEDANPLVVQGSMLVASLMGCE